MTIKEARSRLNKAIKSLNEIQDSIVFEVSETDYSIGFTNHGRVNTDTSYGSYNQTSFFNEYKRKADAYINTMSYAEVILSAAKLLDPNSYHNFKERV